MNRLKQNHIGEKRFSFFNGKLETVTVIEESFAAPGATESTFVVRNDATGEKSRVAKDFFQSTKVDAIRVYLQQCEEGVQSSKKRLQEAVQDLENIFQFFYQTKLALIEAELELANSSTE